MVTMLGAELDDDVAVAHDASVPLWAARDTMEQRASSFALAARLLPEDVRGDVDELYAMFRRLDDLVDDGMPDAVQRIAAVEDWAAGLSDGDATPETRLLSALADRHPIPRDAVGDFCAGMRTDLAGARFESERDLDRYCYCVAGTVGVVMTSLLGSEDPAGARACAVSLGTAMQLTNILRDIDEDAAAGRVYIADETLARFGGSLQPGERAELMRAEIARADELYEDGLLGVRLLRRGRVAVTFAAGLYREILREIEREGLGRHAGRAAVPAARKARTVLRLTLTGR
jgi:phytoene synthase